MHKNKPSLSYRCSLTVARTDPVSYYKDSLSFFVKSAFLTSCCYISKDQLSTKYHHKNWIKLHQTALSSSQGNNKSTPTSLSSNHKYHLQISPTPIAARTLSVRNTTIPTTENHYNLQERPTNETVVNSNHFNLYVPL